MGRHTGSPRNQNFPWRKGNHFEILVDGTAFFPRMLAAIDAAREYLLLEMYLVESGAVADRFIGALLAAAARDVRIHLLFDDFGAGKLMHTDRLRLEHPNIEITYYNPLPSSGTLHNLYRIFWQHITHGLHRDHRKLLLVDGRVAYTGGTGITDLVDPPRAPQQRWRETMIEIRGPVLEDWQALFTETWNQAATSLADLPPVTTAL
ncbi:MAG: phospholipase D-like domain-containing protein, partial [Gammaproteobacteria bacterium]